MQYNKSTNENTLSFGGLMYSNDSSLGKIDKNKMIPVSYETSPCTVDLNLNKKCYASQKKKADEFKQRKGMQNQKVLSEKFYSNNIGNNQGLYDNNSKHVGASSNLINCRNYETDKLQNDFESFGHNSCLNDFYSKSNRDISNSNRKSAKSNQKPFTEIMITDVGNGQDNSMKNNNHVGTYAIQCEYNRIQQCKNDHSIDLNSTVKSIASEMNNQNNLGETVNLNVINQIQQSLINKGINPNQNELREAVGTVIGELLKKGQLGNLIKQENPQNYDVKNGYSSNLYSNNSSNIQGFNSNNVTTNKDTINLLEDNDHLFEFYDTNNTQERKSEDQRNNYMARFLKKKGNNNINPVSNQEMKPMNNLIPNYDTNTGYKTKENNKENIHENKFFYENKFYSNSESKKNSTYQPAKENKSSTKKIPFPITFNNHDNGYTSPMKPNNQNTVQKRNTTNKKIQINQKIEENRSKSVKTYSSKEKAPFNIKMDYRQNVHWNRAKTPGLGTYSKVGSKKSSQERRSGMDRYAN